MTSCLEFNLAWSHLSCCKTPLCADVKFYLNVKSQANLISLWVSCKHDLNQAIVRGRYWIEFLTNWTYWCFREANRLANSILQTLSDRLWYLKWAVITQKMKFSIKDFFSKCGQIRRKLRIWSYLLKKSLMENFTF